MGGGEGARWAGRGEDVRNMTFPKFFVFQIHHSVIILFIVLLAFLVWKAS